MSSSATDFFSIDLKVHNIEKATSLNLTKDFFKLAIPILLSNISGAVVLMINTAIVALREDETQLAAVGVGNLSTLILIVTVLMGLNSTQDTITSVAYGSGNLKLCGVYLNRGAFIMTLFFIPLALIPTLRGEQILIYLGQDREVSRLA